MVATWHYYDCGTGGWFRYEDTGASTPIIRYATGTAWTHTNSTFTTTFTTTSASLTWDWWNDPRVRRYVATRDEVARAEAWRQDPALVAFRAERQRRRTVRESADAKAEALLLRHLDPTQQQTYRHYGWFEIDVGGRVYRLEKGYAGNVTRRDPVTRRTVRRYCAHIDTSLPVQDNLMSQLLAITHDEQGFLRVANVS